MPLPAFAPPAAGRCPVRRGSCSRSPARSRGGMTGGSRGLDDPAGLLADRQAQFQVGDRDRALAVRGARVGRVGGQQLELRHVALEELVGLGVELEDEPGAAGAGAQQAAGDQGLGAHRAPRRAGARRAPMSGGRRVDVGDDRRRAEQREAACRGGGRGGSWPPRLWSAPAAVAQAPAAGERVEFWPVARSPRGGGDRLRRRRSAGGSRPAPASFQVAAAYGPSEAPPHFVVSASALEAGAGPIPFR